MGMAISTMGVREAPETFSSGPALCASHFQMAPLVALRPEVALTDMWMHSSVGLGVAAALNCWSPSINPHPRTGCIDRGLSDGVQCAVCASEGAFVALDRVGEELAPCLWFRRIL